jgi:hypothetical protein
VRRIATKSGLKADEVPSVGVFPLLQLGLLTEGKEGFARWVSPDTGKATEVHVASKGNWLLVEGHAVGLVFLPAFGNPNPCRPQFHCPSCGRRCGRLYKLPEAFYPWRCVRCAGLEYRAKHLNPFDRAERTYGRLAVQGRERRPRERRKRFYNRMVRLQAAERRLEEMAATLLEPPGRKT